MIFDGSSFGTATPAGSEEEADYLGIPGLLDAEQMRDLLRRRQEEQFTKRTASGEARASAVEARTVARTPPPTQRAGVDRAPPHPGKPHGWIHNELRRIWWRPADQPRRPPTIWLARIEAVRGL